MAETGSGRKGFLHTLLKILTGLFSIVLIAAVGALLVLAAAMMAYSYFRLFYKYRVKG